MFVAEEKNEKSGPCITPGGRALKRSASPKTRRNENKNDGSLNPKVFKKILSRENKKRNGPSLNYDEANVGLRRGPLERARSGGPRRK